MSFISIVCWSSLVFFLWEDESMDETPKYPPRTIRVETNGSSRVLIQQLDPPVDLLVREMKAGDQVEVIARGPCKLFCSAVNSLDWTTMDQFSHSAEPVRLPRNSNQKKGANLRPFFRFRCLKIYSSSKYPVQP